MGKLSRTKGAAFENLVCNMIQESFNVTKKDCCRTGYLQINKGLHGQSADIYISDELFTRCPFIIEAKHHRNWHPGVLMIEGLRKQERDWFGQLFESRTSRKDAHPLLVMRGHRTPVYATLRMEEFKKLFRNRQPKCQLRYPNPVDGMIQWILIDAKKFFQALGRRG